MRHLGTTRLSSTAVQLTGTVAGLTLPLVGILGAERPGLLLTFRDGGTATRGQCAGFAITNSATPPAAGATFGMPWGESIAVATRGFSHIHVFSLRTGNDMELSVAVLDADGTRDLLPPLSDPSNYTVSSAANRSLPTLPDGSRAKEILFGVLGADVQDSIAIKLTADAGDATANTAMFVVPSGRLIRLKTAGFTHIRADKPAGQVGNPLGTMAALS